MFDAKSYRASLKGGPGPMGLPREESETDVKVLELKKQQYDYIAAQINREDELVNKRLTWTLTTNGLLFTALGFYAGKSTPMEELVDFFHYFIPLTGIVISIAGFLSVFAAYMQIDYLTKEWEMLKDDRWIRPFGDKVHAYYLGGILAVSPPFMFVIVWGYLLQKWNTFPWF
ncbi:hypothetical protein [Aquabacterium sp.]|uniref:hypothetical protein n=1 Tax=Aquabacterium sp. TaxID=1872578 RepID=UPI003D6D45BD